VTSLVADGDELWIGSSDGVWLRAKGAAPRSLGGGDIRHLAIVDGAVVGAGSEGVITVDRGRVVPLAGAPKGFAQTIGGRQGAACTGGLDGLWTRTAGTWHHAPKAGGPPSSDISSVVADGERLWVGTFDQGLASYDAEHGWRHVDGIDARINAMVIEPGHRLWIGTAEGIQVVDGDGHVVKRLGKNDGLPSRSVLAMARLSDGRIVAGTSVGAAFVNGDTIRRVGPRPPAPPAATEPKRLDDRAVGNVWAIAEAGGSLWLGTTTGLYRGPATAWTSKDGSDDSAAMLDRWQRMSVATGHLKDDWVTAIAVKGDVVWVGTYNGGVSRIDGDTATQLGGGWVNPSGLVWDGDRLLAATMDGLVIGDGHTATWTTKRALPGRDTTGAVRVGQTLWVATRRGLATID
jgi:ligand-binding sensor domain-containing protein